MIESNIYLEMILHTNLDLTVVTPPGKGKKLISGVAYPPGKEKLPILGVPSLSAESKQEP